MKNKPLAYGIDVFAGAGGLSLGAQLAGVEITQAIENHPPAAATHRANHPNTVMIERDVRLISSLAVPKKRPLILFGGPPCQGFSTSNQRTRTIENPKNWLFGEFFRLARMLKPDWIVLENVTGLLETAEGQFQIIIASEFEAIDYTYAVWTLSAIDFGVPQKRSRVFFVGRRKGEIPPAPQPTTRKPVLVREAICDLPQLLPGANTDVLKYLTPASSKYAKTMRRSLRSCSGHLVSANNDTVIRRYAYIPQGGNWCDIPTRLMKNYSDLKNKRSRHTGIYHRLSWDKPSTVIANYRKNMLIHPDQDRGLSVREAARLQSFPDHYNFCGSIGFQQQQVGNAVPPLLAKAVFDQIINFL